MHSHPETWKLFLHLIREWKWFSDGQVSGNEVAICPDNCDDMDMIKSKDNQKPDRMVVTWFLIMCVEF